MSSSCDFLGRMSSMCGSRRGNCSMSLARRARWEEDLTLDLAPGVSLDGC